MIQQQKTNTMNFNNYIFRSSMEGQIRCPNKPLTTNQAETLKDFRERAKGIGRPLTDKQKETWHSLEAKFTESQKYTLSDGQKNILNDIVFYEKWGRIKSLEAKYLDKGNEVEKESRDVLSRMLGIPLTADEERRSNDWVTGKRDIQHNEVIIDIKSKWDFNNFNKCLTDRTNEVYLCQLDNYMDLWGCKSALLAHVLVDTPFYLVERELKRMDFVDNILDINGNVRDENVQDVVSLVEQHIYTRKGLEDFCQQSINVEIDWFSDFVEIPEAERVHMVSHNYDAIRIEQRNESIKVAREYMNTVKPLNNIIKL